MRWGEIISKCPFGLLCEYDTCFWPGCVDSGGYDHIRILVMILSRRDMTSVVEYRDLMNPPPI